MSVRLSHFQDFVADQAADRELQVPLSTLHVKAAYEAFRQICLAGGFSGGGGGAGAGGGGGGGGDSSVALAEAQEVIKKLKVQIKQRNHEIEILVNMLDKKEGCVICSVFFLCPSQCNALCDVIVASQLPPP